MDTELVAEVRRCIESSEPQWQTLFDHHQVLVSRELVEALNRLSQLFVLYKLPAQTRLEKLAAAQDLLAYVLRPLNHGKRDAPMHDEEDDDVPTGADRQRRRLDPDSGSAPEAPVSGTATNVHVSPEQVKQALEEVERLIAEHANLVIQLGDLKEQAVAMADRCSVNEDKCNNEVARHRMLIEAQDFKMENTSKMLDELNAALAAKIAGPVTCSAVVMLQRSTDPDVARCFSEILRAITDTQSVDVLRARYEGEQVVFQALAVMYHRLRPSIEARSSLRIQGLQESQTIQVNRIQQAISKALKLCVRFAERECEKRIYVETQMQQIKSRRAYEAQLLSSDDDAAVGAALAKYEHHRKLSEHHAATVNHFLQEFSRGIWQAAPEALYDKVASTLQLRLQEAKEQEGMSCLKLLEPGFESMTKRYPSSSQPSIASSQGSVATTAAAPPATPVDVDTEPAAAAVAAAAAVDAPMAAEPADAGDRPASTTNDAAIAAALQAEMDAEAAAAAARRAAAPPAPPAATTPSRAGVPPSMSEFRGVRPKPEPPREDTGCRIM